MGIWLLLVLLGKGGFVHLILLVALGITLVEILRVYRSHLREKTAKPTDCYTNKK